MLNENQLGLVAAIEADAKDRGLCAPVEPEPVVALTMTPDAGRLFWKALIYAANRIPREARASHEDLSHEDWLRWGASRLDAAIRAAGSSSPESMEAVNG